MNEVLARVTIHPEATIRDAMEAIDRGAVEIALMADEDCRLLGAVTDGDVRRALLAGASLDSPVKTYVSDHPHTVGPEASRAEVVDLMAARAIEQVPVIDDGGRLVGLHVMRELLGGVDRSNVAVILAGGRGTRLGSLTANVPKPMIPVAGRPILERIVLHLVGVGIRRVVISVGYLAEVIEEHFGDGSAFGCSIEYVREDPERPLGTGGPLALVQELTGPPREPLLLLNGDLVADFPVDDLLHHHEETDAIVTMSYWQHRHEVPYGVLDLSSDGRVVGLIEKPVASWPINAGIYVLDPTILPRIPSDIHYPVTDLIADCLQRGETVSAVEIDGEWHDVGQPEQLRRARGQL